MKPRSPSSSSSSSSLSPSPGPARPAPAKAEASAGASVTAASIARLDELDHLVQLAALHGVDVSDDVLRERESLRSALAVDAAAR
jgi:hypothetical protein